MLLLEGLLGSQDLQVNRDQIKVYEHARANAPLAWVPGRLSVAGIVNGNGRRYRREVWEKNLAEGSRLSTSLRERSSFGLLEHPADGKVDLTSPISHLTVEAKLDGDNLDGAIQIVNTEPGRKLLALIEAGYNPRVSSRGFGTLTRAADGVDEVQDDYVCEGWDVVSVPSFVQAQLRPERPDASRGPSPVFNAPRQEAAAAPTPGQPTAPAQDFPPSTPAKPLTENLFTMDFNQIRESLRSHASVDPTTVTPHQFAESIAALEGLHRHVAVHAGNEAGRSYDAQKLHEAIRAEETRLAEAALAPRRENLVLKADRVRTLKLVKEVGKQALTFKSALGEALKDAAAKGKVCEEVARRGRGWKSRAESAESALSELQDGKLGRLQRKLQVATEALDIMGQRYREDISALGRGLIERDFADRIAADASLKEKLDRATTPKLVMALREELDPESTEKEGEDAPIPGADEGKPAAKHGVDKDGNVKTTAEIEAEKKKNAAKTVQPGTQAPVKDEDKEPKEDNASGKGAVEPAPDAGKQTESVRIVNATPFQDKPFSLNESASLFRRLSKANAD